MAGLGASASAGWSGGCGKRWQTISGLWEQHKARANKLNLLGRLDYHRELSSQLKWQRNPDGRPVRVVYSSSGVPTAALLHDDGPVVDYTLFWVDCKSVQEANYLLAIINSDALYAAVQPLMAKGQFGARHLQKQLWKLPIPEYDGTEGLHGEIAAAGEAAAAGGGAGAGAAAAGARAGDGDDCAAGATQVAAGVGGGGAGGGGGGAVVGVRSGRASPPAPSPPSGEGVYVVGIRICGIRGLAGWGDGMGPQ